MVMERTGDAKFCVSTRGKPRWMDRDVVYVQGCGEDGRRKILRLYKADAIGMEGWDMGDDK